FAGQCPPRERAAETGEHPPGPRALADALDGQRAAANPHEQPRHREPLPGAVPPAPLPNAARGTVTSEIQTFCCGGEIVHVSAPLQIRVHLGAEEPDGFSYTCCPVRNGADACAARPRVVSRTAPARKLNVFGRTPGRLDRSVVRVAWHSRC